MTLPEGRPIDAVLGLSPRAKLDLLDGHDPAVRAELVQGLGEGRVRLSDGEGLGKVKVKVGGSQS